MLNLDHIVIGAASLEQGIAYVQEQLLALFKAKGIIACFQDSTMMDHPPLRGRDGF